MKDRLETAIRAPGRWLRAQTTPLWARRRFGAELASLAWFRIGLGTVLLYDLATRLIDFQAHYTSQGILPIGLIPRGQTGSPFASLHLLSGSPVWQGLLFSCAIFAALALTLGWHSRGASVLSWYLLHSLQARNPLILYGADKLLILLVFWAAFLPLDSRWALGPKTSPAAGQAIRFFSGAVLALKLQVCSVYWFSVLKKTGDTWWDGTAVYYVFQIDQYAKPLAKFLLAYPRLMTGLTWATLLVELLAPFLLLGRRPALRWIGISLLAIMQLGFFACLDLGIFPWVSLVALIPFLPLAPPRSRSLSDPDIATEPDERRHRLAVWLALAALLWNLTVLWKDPASLEARLPGPVRELARILRLDQYWGMFAPDPMVFDGWYVARARLRDGTEVDLLRGGRPLNWEKPSDVLKLFPSDRWKEYLMTLYDLANPEPLWRRVASYWTRQWNQRHSKARQIQELHIIYMMEKTTSAGPDPPVKEPLWPRPPAAAPE